MKIAVWPLLALLLTTVSAAPPPLVTKVPNDQRPVEILDTRFSADRTEATVTLHSQLGIFALQFPATDRKLAKLTLLIRDQRFCEGLDFWPNGGERLELLHQPGVASAPRAKDLAIELTGATLAAVLKGGKLQYVNQYR